MWIAMDYIDGTDAAQLVRERYPAGMPVELATTIVTAVASALDYAHKKGLLHRDVKPANIIVADIDADDPQVFLADFGIARPLDDTSGITTTNMTVGTVAYAAPEQLMGEPMDGRADQYALAATAYQLLTGMQLFPHSNPAVVISRHLSTDPPPLGPHRSDCAVLDDVLQIALAKNPDDRFRSCLAFAQALADESPARGWASANATTRAARRPDRPVSAPGTTTSQQLSPASSTRRTRLILVSIAATVLLLGVIGMLWRPWQHPKSETSATLPGEETLLSTSVPTSVAAAPSAGAPPPVTVVAAPTTSAAQIPVGPTIGDECGDWMKFATDPVSGQTMLCGGYPDNLSHGGSMTWFSAEKGAVGPAKGTVDTPRVGKLGSSCSGEVAMTFGRSSDNYLVWCTGGGQYDPPGSKPTWTKYSP